MNNKKLPADRGRASKLAAFARYKFTLAFENSITQDYVTEKFFDALIAGSLPVYRGAPNIAAFAPDPRSFVDVLHFQGPRELAEYLTYLDRNPAEYATYFAWKARPLDSDFLAMARRYSACPLRRLAEKIALRRGMLESTHVQRDPIHRAIRWRNRA